MKKMRLHLIFINLITVIINNMLLNPDVLSVLETFLEGVKLEIKDNKLEVKYIFCPQCKDDIASTLCFSANMYTFDEDPRISKKWIGNSFKYIKSHSLYLFNKKKNMYYDFASACDRGIIYYTPSHILYQENNEVFGNHLKLNVEVSNDIEIYTSREYATEIFYRTLTRRFGETISCFPLSKFMIDECCRLLFVLDKPEPSLEYICINCIIKFN